MVVMLPIGVVVGTMGYKLWKYTMFCIAFVPGAALGFIFIIIKAVAHDLGWDPDDMVGFVFVCGLITGCMTGICFRASHSVGFVCYGCQGPLLFALPLAMMLPGGATGVWFAIGSLFCMLQLLMHVAACFLKLQKPCIIQGTTFLGAGLTCLRAYYRDVSVGIALHAAVCVAYFCIQWFKTSKGVEIDPHTGQVTVLVAVGGLIQPTTQAPLLAQPGIDVAAPDLLEQRMGSAAVPHQAPQQMNEQHQPQQFAQQPQLPRPSTSTKDMAVSRPASPSRTVGGSE